MAGQLVPSTGAIRKCAPVNYNVRKFQAGDLVLYRASYGSWAFGNIEYATGEAAWIVGVGKTLYRDLVGTIPDRVSPDGLVSQLNELEARYAVSIEKLRREMRETVLGIVEARRLGKLGGMMP